MNPNDHPDPEGDRPVTLEELIALRDGDLDAEQARRLTERLERDPHAAALLTELDETDAILDRLRTRQPPPGFSERLQALIGDEAAARERETGRPHGEDGSGPGTRDDANS